MAEQTTSWPVPRGTITLPDGSVIVAPQARWDASGPAVGAPRRHPPATPTAGANKPAHEVNDG